MILLRRLRIVAFKHLRTIDLWFPRNGSILIEGHNESGKSTLFEAIYFALYGKALVGEDSGIPSLDALVPHGESRAAVQLTIQAGTTELEITRTLTRNSQQKTKHEAEARIHRPGKPVETISAVGAVNDCILGEMNGLDSNVLRNSCLMEQQALDRIETLGRDAREMAIAKLLGIEAIQRIEGDLRVARKDEVQLAQAQTRLEVARKSEEAREAGAEVQRVRVAFQAAKARTALTARDEFATELRATQAELAGLMSKTDQIQADSQRAATLEALRVRSDETEQVLRDAERETDALQIMRASQDHMIGAHDVESQLAQADADLRVAEAREQEQLARVTKAKRQSRIASLFILAASAVALVAGGAVVATGLEWLLAMVIAAVLAAIVEVVHWLHVRGVVRAEDAKLAILDRDLLQLRATHATMQRFSFSAGAGGQSATADLATQQQKSTAAHDTGERALRDLAQAFTQAGMVITTDGLTLASVSEMRQALETMRQALQAELARVDVQAVLREQGGLGERAQYLHMKCDDLTARQDAARQRLVAELVELGIVATGEEPLEILVAKWPALADENGDPDSIAAALEGASAIEGRLCQEVAALCQRHGLDAETLDAAECQRVCDELDRELRQRRLAAEMADEVFRRIVKRVLPETEMHMRALLPDLTDGRYRDVKLLGGDENSADLHIEIWDEQAGRFVGKRLFSGGARDQCSLALRLAFALATLPKELGAMPGFIFLDEPLSSFDDRRSQALVDVLTRGAIAKQFPQVFLISHSQSFDPAAFTCALRMSAGRIASSTLPNEDAARVLWETDLTPAAH